MNRKIAAICIGLSAVAVSLALMVVGAIATPLHFDRCVPYTLGTHKDDKCTEAGGGPYKRIAITEGSSAPFTGVQLSNHVISGTVSGTSVDVTVVCKKASSSGALENPSGGGAGMVSEGEIKLSECSVTEPEYGCQISGGTITTNALSGATAAGPKIELEAEGEGAIAKFTFEKCDEGCSKPPLNKTHELSGSAVGSFVNGQSKLDFTTTSGSSLTVGGAAATFTGTDELESEEYAVFVE